jgi:putative membrane protein
MAGVVPRIKAWAPPSRRLSVPVHTSSCPARPVLISWRLTPEAFDVDTADSATESTPLTPSFHPFSSFAHNTTGRLASLSLPFLAVTVGSSLPADAATAAVGPVPSALVAYTHYVGLLLCTACIVQERALVSTTMSTSDESTLRTTNLVYWLSALVVIASGGVRVGAYGKGWEFYSHEPWFWVKLALVGVWTASSCFPTIQHILREQSKNPATGQYYPMSEALVSRMQSLYVAELTALLFIPVAATLMARGVGYWNDLPWPAGAALVILPSAGLTYKYVKEAMTWQEPPPVVDLDQSD